MNLHAVPTALATGRMWISGEPDGVPPQHYKPLSGSRRRLSSFLRFVRGIAIMPPMPPVQYPERTQVRLAVGTRAALRRRQIPGESEAGIIRRALEQWIEATPARTPRSLAEPRKGRK